MNETIKEFLKAALSFLNANANPVVKKELGIIRLNMNELGAIFLSFFGDSSDEKSKDYIIFYHKTYKELFEKTKFLKTCSHISHRNITKLF